MDPLYFHLMLNHVPIITTIFSVLILFFGMYKSEKMVINLSLIGFVMAGMFSIIVLMTGNAVEIITDMADGVSLTFLQEHSAAAKTANAISIVVAVAALAGFVVNKFKPAFFGKVKWTIAVMGLVSAGFFNYTAFLGAQIHHPEIQFTQFEENKPAEDGFIESCSKGVEETLGDEFAQ